MLNYQRVNLMIDLHFWVEAISGSVGMVNCGTQLSIPGAVEPTEYDQTLNAAVWRVHKWEWFQVWPRTRGLPVMRTCQKRNRNMLSIMLPVIVSRVMETFLQGWWVRILSRSTAGHSTWEFTLPIWSDWVQCKHVEKGGSRDAWGWVPKLATHFGMCWSLYQWLSLTEQ